MKNLYDNLPETPGVYLMKNRKGEVIYVGKAGNLKKRVKSYFLKGRDFKTLLLRQEIKRIDFKKTDTVIEALILEAELIKKLKPLYNIKDKDDKSFLYVVFTKERFPRVLLVRGKEKDGFEGFFGPFTSATSLREALRIVRKMFPFSIHPDNLVGIFKRPCFDYEIGLCPGTCIGEITRKDYLKNIRNIKLFFKGKKLKLISSLKKEMKDFSSCLQFEKAEKARRQIEALIHVKDIALLSDSDFFKSSLKKEVFRIEGYDVSNISGTFAVGSMVVFQNGKPFKCGYRRFKIQTFNSPNDTGMLREVVSRRLSNPWPFPDLMLIDGGKGQVNAVLKVLDEQGISIPVLGIAKGKDRKMNRIVGDIPKGIEKNTLIRVRNEAHRFAISYHKKLRSVI